jgi:NAD(P)H dehydrogenase (quinone)
MKALVLYYSMYGHIHTMAEAIAEGVKEVPGAEVALKRVPETLPEEVLKKMGVLEAQKGFAHVPVCKVSELTSYDAIFFGTPTRFGNMCGQMRQFLDAKVYGRPTILTFHTNLLAHGMVIVGLPYTFQGQMRTDEITGGSPYGASTIAGTDGDRTPSENELAAARFQGKHVAAIAAKLAK